MTRVKAIQILNGMFDSYLIMEKVCSAAIGEFDDKQLIRYRLDEITDKKIAILTAIDVLKQSSSVEADPMGEYISKQSVIDYLNGYLNSIGEDGTYNPLFDRGQRRALINSIQDISAIKAADVQPVKHGRWIYQRDNLRLCSYCKENLIYSETETDRAEKQRYCSRCGARMDGDNNG